MQPSDVPGTSEASGSYARSPTSSRWWTICVSPRAHVFGLSMGGFAAVHFGLDHADRAHSLTVAGPGYGAEKRDEANFRDVSLGVAKGFETQGAACRRAGPRSTTWRRDSGPCRCRR